MRVNSYLVVPRGVLCLVLLSRGPPDHPLMSADKIFEALSSAPRRRILAYLSKTDMTAGEIALRFADMMSQPAISKHLSVLENAGLVWREKRGMNVHYGLKEDALTGTLVHFLAEVCPRSRPFRKDSAAAAK